MIYLFGLVYSRSGYLPLEEEQRQGVYCIRALRTSEWPLCPPTPCLMSQNKCTKVVSVHVTFRICTSKAFKSYNALVLLSFFLFPIYLVYLHKCILPFLKKYLGLP